MALPTTAKFVQADGLKLFYREAQPKDRADAPVLLLLHGFPSSSHQYRNLIPLLSPKYRILAPDLPGFGFTEVPEGRDYSYSFSSLSNTLGKFLDALSITRFAVYIFDYGAPTALRLALERPEVITAIITQNGNAYSEGLGLFWQPLRSFWETGSPYEREAIRKAFLNLPTTQWQYLNGTPASHLPNIAPEAAYLDYALFSRPGNSDIQLSLLFDYQKNVELYPHFQEYFRQSKVPILAVWGRNDEIFVEAGADAFARDGHAAEVVLLDAGHFAVESHTVEIAELVLDFLSRKGI